MRWRGPAAVGALVAATVGLVVWATAGPPDKPLDPRSAGADGARALVTLLRDRGVHVEPVVGAARASTRAAPGDLLLVADPYRFGPADLGRLADTPAALVVLGADSHALAALRLPLDQADDTPVDAHRPGCALPAARVAGRAVTGGITYGAAGADVRAACYPVDGHPSLVQLVADGRPVTLLGAPDAFTNGRLADEGDAALALSLLDRDRVVWALPEPQAAARVGGRQGLLDLLPGRLLYAGLDVLVAVVLVGLWRARWLGPVVAERLPVSVRGSETVEGRARLYRAARARGTAAAALRAAARRRLAATLGLPPAADDALVGAVADRSGSSAAEVRDLLYGADPGPRDDAALVRLADALDALVAQVRRS